ncbi:hypothetical protein EDB29_102477 [Vibrio crassostreae]|uniref:hypothetical protein n=1 Tax=Vibrio crassostreae TaxID=246167 RepID=UPI001046D31C|nr:hypothetical protein [Vibrio crassostreae]TCT42639.1 hypothetical protein EDB29_102477 [Vibrio crassostreae]
MKTVSLIVVFFSFNVLADNFDHCNSLIEHGVTNVTRHMSAEHSIAYKWHSNCGQDFNSSSDSSVKKASISIFGYGSGGGDSNSSHMRSRLKQWCDNNSEFASSRQKLFEEARTISEPALDAWNQCQNIAKKGIKITPSVQGENDEFIHFTVDSTSDGTHLFYGVTQAGYSCTIENKDGSELASDKINKGADEFFVMTKSKPTIDNSNIHISCRRSPPDISEVNGVGTLKYTQGHISVMTSGPALPITIPKIVESYNVTPPKSVLAFASASCPQGWIEYEPAYGRFIRGIDKSGSNIDPEGSREYGHIQNDTLKSHSHPHEDIYWMEAWGKQNHALKNTVGDSGGDGDNEPYIYNSKTSNTGDEETRPKNVALLYCMKK